MNKQKQINELKVALADAYESIDRKDKRIEHGRQINDRLVQEANAKAALDESTKRAAAEAETLKHIRNGMIPVAELRRLVRQERVVTQNAETTSTDLTVLIRHADPIDKAILDALLAKPIKYHEYTLATLPPFKVGDRVNVQTLPNNGGFLINGPVPTLDPAKLAASHTLTVNGVAIV